MFLYTKLRWAWKLLRSKYFVILTDKESVIAMSGYDPKKFNDFLAVSAQTAAIDGFLESLKRLRKDHEKIVDSFSDATSVKKPKARSTNVSNTRAPKTKSARKSR